MDCENSYSSAAEKYRPKWVRVLFVAEAPPSAVERYFFFEEVLREDWLWIALMKAIYPSEWTNAKIERPRKRAWLEKFKRSQYWLIDAVKAPISGSDSKRVQLVRSNTLMLIEEVKEINPEQIVLIKATVYKALFHTFREVHLPVVDQEPLPFPSTGQQAVFHQAFRRLIKAGILEL
jgi:radical SAM superfamily enzyme YgiQ (UPF0313 family)